MQEVTEHIEEPPLHTFFTRSGIAITARQAQVDQWVECQKRMVAFKAKAGDWVILVGPRTYVMTDKDFRDSYVEQRD